MRTRKRVYLITLTIIIAVASVAMLFRLSTTIIHYHNSLTRSFPPHSAQELYKIDLEYNSYYIAGINNGKIFLGNSSTPLIITVLDTALKNSKTYKLDLKERHLPFHRPKIKVLGNDFFLYEGAVPYVFKGSTSNWKARLRYNSGRKFSQFEPIDSLNFVARFDHPVTQEYHLGAINLGDTMQRNYQEGLLTKQIDGIFDSDGQLHFDQKIKRVVYLYSYRNEFVVTKPDMMLDFRANTIDTTTKANIKITNIESHDMLTFSAPPFKVNNTSAVFGGLLYSNSTVPGKYEDDYLWKNASIIDVYDVKSQGYKNSFPIYHIGSKKLRSFIVANHRLYALIGTHIVVYKMLNDISN